MHDRPFHERVEILETYLADVANRGPGPEGIGGLTQGEAIDLLNLLASQREELRDAEYETEGLREELENAHDAYASLHRYTRGALAAYAKDRLRLIGERDRAINGLKQFARDCVEQGDEIDRLKDELWREQDKVRALSASLRGISG